jgi:hypothetical protein
MEMPMPELTNFFRDASWIVVASITVSVFFLWLLVTGGKDYSAEDAEAHAQEFGGLVKEGHGRMTSFLWVSFTLLIVWTIYYFSVHWHEFAVILTQG